MSVAVVGGGAMGCLWAADLARTNDVVVIDVAPEVVAAINAAGISVRRPDGAEAVSRVTATSAPETAQAVDLLLMFVKAHHTAAAAAAVRSLARADTVVVTLQNGIGNADLLADVFAPEQIVIGVTYASARALGPGMVAQTGRGVTVVGPYQVGGALTGAERVAVLLREAGFETRVTPAVQTEIWKKLVLNSATLPVTALARVTASDCHQSPRLRALLDQIAAESVAVARAHGHDIDVMERIEAIHAAQAKSRGGKGSMLQDVEAGRRTEVEVISGAVVRAAREVNLEVPLNQAMLALVSGLDAGGGRQA